MSSIALIGSITLIINKKTLEHILLMLVSLSAGSLLGGAFFHLLPAALIAIGSVTHTFAWTLTGFAIFFVIEQFLHWRHCHSAVVSARQPLTYLILIGDGLHNFVGGLAIGSTFLIDIRLGIMAWLAAVAHEIPQELGDFGVLIYGGWQKTSALVFNFISGLTFLLGGIVSYLLSYLIDVSVLVALAAGNFIYIAASDLIPEVNKQVGLKKSLYNFIFFAVGICLLYVLSVQ